jgi:predicted nucleic acid-binding protein
MKLYLDISLISALFDERNPERKSLTEAFFKESRELHIFISEITVAEIERVPDGELRGKMKQAVAGFSELSLTDEVEGIASEYIRQGAVPPGYREDAYHIAIAVVNEMGCLLRWNFRHIVRRRTREIVRMVNTLNNLTQIEIVTPAEFLQEAANEEGHRKTHSANRKSCSPGVPRRPRSATGSHCEKDSWFGGRIPGIKSS